MLSNLAFLIVPFLATLSASALSSRQDSPTVRTLNGTYSGIYSLEYNQDFFLGIPYAQPPLGDLRFRQAQPLNTSWTETKTATEYSPECIGYGSDQWVLGNKISEDCLTLNVVRPSDATGSLPVAVWIHGGGLRQGGNADPRYNLSRIIQQSVYSGSPIIAVSINYRLSGWGFLFGKEIAAAGAANIGIRDQRLALHWVQENIAAFGGNPAKVTIFGESAGGWSVGTQLIAYGGRDDGLFRGAISQSGAPAGLAPPTLTAELWQPYYEKITKATNCSGTADSLACLRQVPVDVLSNVFNSSVTTGAPLQPVVDGDFIPDTPTTLLRDGKFLKVPYLLGANHDEGTAFGRRGINTTEQFLGTLTAAGIDNATAATVAAVYPDIPEIGIPPTFEGRPPASLRYGSQFKRAAAFGGDTKMHAPRRLTSQAWAKHNVTSYSYVFNVMPNGVDYTTGATHFQEVAFVFYNLEGDGYKNVVAVPPFEGKPESYSQLARLMSRMWISFIVDGDPNNSGVSAIYWPEYTLDKPRNIIFDTNVTALAYVQPDTYRAEGIEYVSTHILTTLGSI
ncbi:Alpha/Beta hydrolase protein [Bisporella sp. PMI_857]|nr:Alpha/Beta hydrolase protein [Bisporella sp. PMI_857]